MRIAKMMIVVLIMVLASLATDAMAEEKIYRWVDANGQVHFGDTPPGNAATEEVTILQDTVGAAPSTEAAPSDQSKTLEEPQPSYAERLREERYEKRKEREEQERVTAEACAQRQTLVSQLEPSTRVMVKMDDGTVTRLDDDKRLEILDEAKSFIANNCNKK